MPIRLDRLKRVDPRTTIDDSLPQQTPGNMYVYKDVEFDIKFTGFNGNIPANIVSDKTDIGDLIDIHDIKQSLNNMFNTKPGDRLINPFFGINLSNFVFDPITTITSDLIGRTILEGIRTYEPRVTVDNLNVVGYPDENEYRITFTFSFVDENISETGLVGILNSDGFKFEGN